MRFCSKISLCHLYTREVGAWRKEHSHWLGASYACLLMEIHCTLELLTWELEFFTGLATLEGLLDGSYVEPLSHFWQALGQNPMLPPWGSSGMSGIWALICGPKPLGFKHSLACHESSFSLSWMLRCLVLLPRWYLTFHLLNLLRAWILFKLSVVQALDESLWAPSVKLLIIASLSSHVKELLKFCIPYLHFSFMIGVISHR